MSSVTPPKPTLTRTIHPVGQGAFYSERFAFDGRKASHFTAVYDCGSQEKTIVRKRTKEIGGVDILFVSHFHDDHTNGVEDLLKQSLEAGVETLVVIPAISHCRFIVDLISNYIRTGDIHCVSIRFMLRCIPALSKPTTPRTPISIQGDLMSRPVTKGGIIALPHRVSLQIVLMPFHWCYDAFYGEFAVSKEQELIKALSERIPPLKEVLSKPNEYRDSEWYGEFLEGLSDLLTSGRISKDDIKAAYELVFGKYHNSYSMLVYSHPEPRHLDKGMDCLYTGDAEIDGGLIKIIKDCDAHYIQVPHHGSEKNHKKDIYRRRQIAFVSVGTNNTFGHPSPWVLVDLVHVCPYVHVITESKDTEFKRRFTL